jgi:FAD/FMN-containing dehydrogenase
VASPLRLAAAELLNPSAARILGPTDSQWWLLLGLEGLRSDVDEMSRRLVAMAAERKLGDWREPDADYFALWSQVTDLAGDGADVPMLKASCPLSDTVWLASELNALDRQVALRASMGLGLVHCAVTSKLGLPDYQHRAEALAGQCDGRASWLVPTPVGLCTAPQGAALEICRRLKDALDPHGILPDVLSAERGGLLPIHQ